MGGKIGGGKPSGLWTNGVVALTGAALLSKLIGSLQKIPLQNMAGDRVFGLYNAVYPLYQLVAVLATAGLPTAVSIVIARQFRKGNADSAGERLALKAALLLLGASGLASFLLMWLGAETIALWLGDGSAAPAIRALAVALLASPLGAALRGYMQGRGLMGYSALSQVADQLVRVSVMLSALGAGLAAGWSDAALAAAVMSGSAAGASVALLLLIVWLAKIRRTEDSMPSDGFRAHGGVGSGAKTGQGRNGERDQERRSGARTELIRLSGASEGQRSPKAAPRLHQAGAAAHRKAGGRERKPLRPNGAGRRLSAAMKELALLAVPAALASVVVPALGVVDAFTVPRFLLAEGISGASSMEMFGVYSRAQPLVQLVVMAAGAASAALVPGFVADKLSGRFQDAALRLSLLMRLSWSIGAAASVGLVLLAEPINVMLYKDAQGTAAFALTGMTALAGCVSAAAAPALQSLGAARISAALLLLAALLKGALNAALVPSLGIQGAAISGVVALSAAAWLGAAALRRSAASAGAPPAAASAGAGGAVRPAAGAALALAALAAALWLLRRGLGPALEGALSPRTAAAALALTGVAVGAVLFAAAMLRCGGIGAREWRALPGGEAMAARLKRWRLIPGYRDDRGR